MKFTNSYNNNNDDDDDDDEEYEEVEAEIMAEALAQSNKNREEEINLAKKHLKYDLMDKAMSICRGGWFWGFLSHSTRLKQIAETFDTLQRLVAE